MAASFDQYQFIVSQPNFKYKYFLFYKKLNYNPQEISAIAIYQKIQPSIEDIALLESKAPGVGRYRFSLIGFESELDIEIYQNYYSVKNNIDKTYHSFDSKKFISPIMFINQYFDDQLAFCDIYFSGFIGGLFGFFTYDAFGFFENISNSHPKVTSEPEIYLAKYNKFILYDYEEGSVYIANSKKITQDLKLDYQEAQDNLVELENYFKDNNNFTHIQYQPTQSFIKCDTEINDKEYSKIIQRGKEYCRMGDVFQVVLSRKFFYPITNDTMDSFALYRTLRQVSPAPYMFYFKIKGETYFGASPEKLLEVKNQKVSVTPLAGTRAINHNSNIDNLKNELKNDPKEMSEHLMLVDLGRNDLGAVCQIGSVEVLEYARIKEFIHIMHISSEIQGILKQRYNCFDALAKVFPAGTLSGAPKIRAMEIINELEHSRRGLYGGGIFTINHVKDMLTCIPIRMAHYKNKLVTVQCGAGIVYDSIVENEVIETWNKAQSVLKAIYIANNGKVII